MSLFTPFEYFRRIARDMTHFLQQPCDDEVLYLEGQTAGALVPTYEFLREPNLCGSQYVPLYQARSWVPEGFWVDIGLTRCRDA